jgi:O-antigen/teichoic acid export membrane protein
LISSGSNVLVLILAARSLPAEGFGRFALAMTVCTVGVFLARGLASDPLATDHAGDPPEVLRAAIRAGAATALVASAVVAVPAGLIAFAIEGSTGDVVLAIAFLLPGLILQDYLRYALIVAGDARGTFFNDAFWLVVQIPLMLLTISLDGGSVWLLIAWAGGGHLAALLGLAQARTWAGRPALVRPWLADHKDLWPYYTLDNMLRQASILLVVIALSIISSVAEVGAVRGALAFYAPLAILSRGIVGVAVPELARRRDDPEKVRRASLALGFVLAPMALVVGALTLLIPDDVGRMLLGDSWRLTAPLLLLAAGPSAAAQFTSGALVGIRALGAARDGLTARVIVSVLAAGCATVGAMIDGAQGAMLVLALSAPFQIATWWGLLNKAARAPQPSSGLTSRPLPQNSEQESQ